MARLVGRARTYANGNARGRGAGTAVAHNVSTETTPNRRAARISNWANAKIRLITGSGNKEETNGGVRTKA